MFLSWWHQWKGRQPRPSHLPARPRRPRPNVEQLEARVLLANYVCQAPGQPDQTVTADFRWLSKKTTLRNELGLVRVDDASGRIGGVRPGDAGYLAAALTPGRSVVLFPRGSKPGAARSVPLAGGGLFGLFLVRNATTQQALLRNPQNRAKRGPVVFFSFAAANPKGRDHLRKLPDNGFAFEDALTGKRDFKDLVGRLTFGAPPPPRPTRDTQPPQVMILSPAPGLTTADNLTLTGRVTDDRSGVAALQAQVDAGAFAAVSFDAAGSFTFTTSLPLDGAADGGHTVRLRAADGSGNVSPLVSFSFTLDAPDPPIPSLAESTSFLYTGSNPVQQGVAPGTINPLRAAVLRGKVSDRAGAPLQGVTVTVLSHPEYGHTQTGAGGVFDLAVNGGGPLTVNYTKDGLLPAQRQVQAPWQDYAWMPDVVLIPRDSQVTSIDLTANTSTQVAQGSPVTDADGTRQATLLFSQGTQATMTLPDGTSQPLTILSVRATEYTVGPSGPAAMPAGLPPTSGYTYAVEYSVDEAEAAGATGVQFSQPVISYVENFLGMPVGLAVPVGSYDRQQGVWVASDNGRVIKILSATGDLDTDGNGTADDAPTLAALGVTPAEQQRLAALYEPGQSLWRVPIRHFSPLDKNLPVQCSDVDGDGVEDCDPPDQPKPVGDFPLDDCCTAAGSIIQLQNQALGEAVGVSGTPFRLYYQSDRVPGRKAARSLQVPLTGASLPKGLLRVDLQIVVAGRPFFESFSPQPNLTHTFLWDGLDAYGRPVQGSQPVLVRLGYVYRAEYEAPANSERSFALAGVANTLDLERGEVTVLQETRTVLGTWDARGLGLGGWSLDMHHTYDPAGRVLYLGDGGRRDAGVPDVITTVAGNGVTFPIPPDHGDGGPATQAQLVKPRHVAAGPDGSLYITDNHSIRRVGPNGIITTVAGIDQPDFGGGGFGGDGALATNALLNQPGKVAIGPDGSLYIPDSNNHRVRRVDGKTGIITTVVGTGTDGDGGDGGPATQAQIGRASSVAIGPDGALYIADGRRVRRVADGIINTFVGGGGNGFVDPEGLPATEVFAQPNDLAFGPDGSLYLSESGNFYRVRRVGHDGLITAVAGDWRGGAGETGDGGPATEALLRDPVGIAFGPDGNLYIADDSNLRVRVVSPEGIITTAAGTGFAGFGGDNGPATRAQVSPLGVAVGPDGNLYMADVPNRRIRRVSPGLPGLSSGDLLIPAEDGSEVYVFSRGGLHLRTVDALTGALRYRFGYDSAGRLASVTDGNGNVTTIQRDAAGAPTSILAPRGQRTTLAPNADGYLASVTNPANEVVQFTYFPDGLLATLTEPLGVAEPNGHTHRFFYDPLGRLRRDEDPAGGFSELGRTELDDGYTVTVTTAEGMNSTYRVEDLPAGGQQRVNTGPDHLSTVTVIGADGSRTTTGPDGTVTRLVLGPDPRFGMLAPLTASLTVKSPAGLLLTRLEARSVTLSAPANPLSLATQIDTVTLNGHASTTTFDAAAKTLTSLTPEGRQIVTTLDDKGRVAAVKVPERDLIQFTYNAQGDVESVKQGTMAQGMRTYTWVYDTQGNVKSITDPLTHVTAFTYDLAGRVKQETLPDGSVVGIDYDANSNVKSVTPAGRPAHTLTVTAVNLVKDYIPPDVGAGTNQTHYDYNLDRQPTFDRRPDGVTVGYDYDAAYRLSTITQPRGTIELGYDPLTGNLKTITAPGAGTLTYGSDGGLLTDTTWSGPVAGNVHRTYDSNFRLATESVNGGPTVSFQYDDDGLLKQAGALTLRREDPQNSRLTGTTLGIVTDTLGYDRFGEVGAYQAAAGGATLFSVQDMPDDLGRVHQRTETVGGVTDTYVYTYDLAGRLTDVAKGGVLESHYVYDANGNRRSHTTPGGTVTGNYDDQDRLSTYGTQTYTYTANGELLTKTDAATSQTTTYSYDALGNLLTVVLPGNTQVEYLVDGQNRRIGRKVNGVLMQGFLYRDGLGPVAELDGAGNVVSRFVYAGAGNVPAYLVRGGVTYRILTDRLGSPRLVVNTTTGEVVQRMDYDEFGNVTADTNPGFQPFGFAGGLYDHATGLVRFGARDYDPLAGRWTAKDPIRFGGGQANLYAYVENDPVNFSDPIGLGSFFVCDSAATCQIMRDIDAMNQGTISPQEFQERANARGVAALAGVALAGLAELAIAAPELVAIAGPGVTSQGDKVGRFVDVFEQYVQQGTPAVADIAQTPAGRTLLMECIETGGSLIPAANNSQVVSNLTEFLKVAQIFAQAYERIHH